MRASLAAGWTLQVLGWSASLMLVRGRAASRAEWTWESALRLGMVGLVIAALGMSPASDDMPLSPAVGGLCLATFWLGQVVAIVARVQLGSSWSIGTAPRTLAPTRGGLYRFLRHPIYLGMLISTGAQVPLLQNLPAVGLFVGAVVVAWVKGNREDQRLFPTAARRALMSVGLRSRPARFALAVAGVAAGAVLVVVLQGAYRTATDNVASYLAQPGADLWIAPAGNDNFIRSSALLPERLVDSVRMVAGVAAADPVVRAFVVAKDRRGPNARRLTLYGIGYRAPAGLGGPPAFAAGRAPIGRNEVALDRAAAYRLDARLGDTLWIAGRAAVVVGLTQGTNLLVTQFVFGNLATTAAASGFGGRASFLIVRGDRGVGLAGLAEQLRSRFPDVAVFEQAAFVANTQREAGSGYVPLFILVNVVGVSAAALLVALLVHGVMEDRRVDLAVLLALGADMPTLTRALVGHAARLVLAGALGGVAAALGLAAILDRFNPVIPLRIESAPVAVALALFLAAGILAAAIPVLRLRRIDPLEAFRP